MFIYETEIVMKGIAPCKINCLHLAAALPTLDAGAPKSPEALINELKIILTLNAVVVKMQVLKVSVKERNCSKLVVGQLQVQQGGHIEHSFGNPFITQLIVVQPHKRQVSHAFKVAPVQDNHKRCNNFKGSVL